MRAPSCQIEQTKFSPEVPDGSTMDQIPLEKQKVIEAYALKLRKKWPQMKKDRLMRKVAEHFKIKLV